jgi:hypothetical protein
MKPLIRFVQVEKEGKTKTFNVFSNHSDDFLGTIHYKPTWRCYVMSYDEVDMSLSCEKELVAFIQELEDERKLKLIEEKEVKKNG